MEQAERVAMSASCQSLRRDRHEARVANAQLQGHPAHSGRTALAGTVGRVDRPGSASPPLPCGELRALLEGKRAELLSRIDQFGASDPAETSNLNFGKRIGDGTTYAVERMTGAYQARTLYETVKEIDQALERIDDGSYGLCESCGQAIPAERLRALPWAALCVPCSGRAGQRRG